jgi:hypothetical protein
MYNSFDEQVACILTTKKKTPDQSKYKDPNEKFSIARVHPTNESVLLKILVPATGAAIGGMMLPKAKEAADKLKKKGEERTKLPVSEACWKGYKQYGMKKKGKKEVPNCVPVKEQMIRDPQTKADAYLRGNYFRGLPPKERLEVLKRHAGMVKGTATPADKQLLNNSKTYEDFISEASSAAWQKSEGKSKSGGLNERGRKSYERENPGSDLKAPSKKVGNPRRKSFCARMKGMKKKLTSKKTARDPDSRINKSLRAWNC